jgi:hypothetical protein
VCKWRAHTGGCCASDSASPRLTARLIGFNAFIKRIPASRAAFQFKRNHAAETRYLTFCQFMLRETLQARVIQLPSAYAPAGFSAMISALSMAFQTQRQGFHAAHNQLRIMW